ncbi:hypothetical protein HJFPF1_08171 [Paramyrothecium foliicola]|nr:hypothetical protein HJFPF1_08171 [Paramyrothecium foliicola]
MQIPIHTTDLRLFLKLPPELWRVVASVADSQTLKALSRTSKTLREHCMTKLFANLRIHGSHDKIWETLRDLELGSGNLQLPEVRDFVKSSQLGISASEVESTAAPEHLAEARRLLPRQIKDTLSSLKFLKQFYFNLNQFGAELEEDTAKSLTELRACDITSLCLFSNSSAAVALLEKCPRLQVFTFVPFETFSREVENQLALSQPDLRVLQIDLGDSPKLRHMSATSIDEDLIKRLLLKLPQLRGLAIEKVLSMFDPNKSHALQSFGQDYSIERLIATLNKFPRLRCFGFGIDNAAVRVLQEQARNKDLSRQEDQEGPPGQISSCDDIWHYTLLRKVMTGVPHLEYLNIISTEPFKYGCSRMEPGQKFTFSTTRFHPDWWELPFNPEDWHFLIRDEQPTLFQLTGFSELSKYTSEWGAGENKG